MSDIEPINIRGKLQYFSKQVSEYSGKYEVTVTNLSDEDVAKLQAIGVEVSNLDAYKKNCMRMDHTPSEEKLQEVAAWGNYVKSRTQFFPAIYDAKAQPMYNYHSKVGSIEGLPDVGNGTDAVVSLSFYSYQQKKGKGTVTKVGHNPAAIQIINLIEYEGGGTSRFETVEGGFEASTDTPPFTPTNTAASSDQPLFDE